MEQWKVIDGTDGMLEVSNTGKIKSNLRDGRILKANADPKGYMKIRVTIKRRKMCFKVHREVAKAFIPNPGNLPQVNHIDGNKNNNDVSNLEWISNYDNAHHAIENGLWGNVFKASKTTAERLSVPVVAVDVKTGEQMMFQSINDACKYFGTKHVGNVLKGQRKKAAGHYFYALGREGVV